MVEQTHGKLNWLEHHLPEGLLVDSTWFTEHGYSTALRSHYLSAGWLEQPVRRVYRRPRGPLAWQQLVVSLQTLLRRDLVVGGRSALEHQGYSHYLQQTTTQIYLYGPKPPPTWLKDLSAGVTFLYRNDGRLFRQERASAAPYSLEAQSAPEGASRPESIAAVPWGQWDWPMMVSRPERAILELLDELPDHESFHQADVLMEGLTTLSPTRMQKLLTDCHSVKVKRLFFFFADRHQHAWLKRINRKAIDLGKGKRVLAKGGKLDTRYLITVPGDLDGVQ
ncbi:MAG: type IV toxin-antitoxin system AbiEi family antitoxin domain-containing protein [Hyphomicrobium sp.]